MLNGSIPIWIGARSKLNLNSVLVSFSNSSSSYKDNKTAKSVLVRPPAGSMTDGVNLFSVTGSKYFKSLPLLSWCAFKSKLPLLAIPSSSPHPHGYSNSISDVFFA